MSESIDKKISESINEIISIGIAGSNSWVYTWFKDQVVMAGSSTNLGEHSNAYAYDLPRGVSPTDLVGVGIAKIGKDRDWCYALYNNQMRTVGKSSDLDKYLTLRNYELPNGKTVDDIIDIGISSKDFVYTWYKDNTRSYGTSLNLGKYQEPMTYTLPSGKRPGDIVGIAIAPNDWCYAWYKDGTVSAGTSRNLEKYQRCHKYIVHIDVD